VAFRPDGKILASGSGDGRVKLRRATTGKEAASLRGARGIISSLAFSGDGKTLAAGGDEILVWDVASLLGPRQQR
jgi:WD40 repeat protein